MWGWTRRHQVWVKRGQLHHRQRIQEWRVPNVPVTREREVLLETSGHQLLHELLIVRW
jgi:hypothetical protein